MASCSAPCLALGRHVWGRCDVEPDGSAQWQHASAGQQSSPQAVATLWDVEVLRRSACNCTPRTAMPNLVFSKIVGAEVVVVVVVAVARCLPPVIPAAPTALVMASPCAKANIVTVTAYSRSKAILRMQSREAPGLGLSPKRLRAGASTCRGD